MAHRSVYERPESRRSIIAALDNDDGSIIAALDNDTDDAFLDAWWNNFFSVSRSIEQNRPNVTMTPSMSHFDDNSCWLTLRNLSYDKISNLLGACDGKKLDTLRNLVNEIKETLLLLDRDKSSLESSIETDDIVEEVEDRSVATKEIVNENIDYQPTVKQRRCEEREEEEEEQEEEKTEETRDDRLDDRRSLHMQVSKDNGEQQCRSSMITSDLTSRTTKRLKLIMKVDECVKSLIFGILMCMPTNGNRDRVSYVLEVARYLRSSRFATIDSSENDEIFNYLMDVLGNRGRMKVNTSRQMKLCGTFLIAIQRLERSTRENKRFEAVVESSGMLAKVFTQFVNKVGSGDERNGTDVWNRKVVPVHVNISERKNAIALNVLGTVGETRELALIDVVSCTLDVEKRHVIVKAFATVILSSREK